MMVAIELEKCLFYRKIVINDIQMYDKKERQKPFSLKKLIAYQNM